MKIGGTRHTPPATVGDLAVMEDSISLQEAADRRFGVAKNTEKSFIRPAGYGLDFTDCRLKLIRSILRDNLRNRAVLSLPAAVSGRIERF